ncbi:MAG: hypothetical protein WCG35_10835 [Betaproteobacteria bacterium]
MNIRKALLLSETVALITIAAIGASFVFFMMAYFSEYFKYSSSDRYMIYVFIALAVSNLLALQQFWLLGYRTASGLTYHFSWAFWITVIAMGGDVLIFQSPVALLVVIPVLVIVSHFIIVQLNLRG